MKETLKSADAVFVEGAAESAGGAAETEAAVTVKTTKRHNGRRFAAFMLIFILLYNLVAGLLNSNEYISSANVKGFYQEKKNSLDVVLIGSSEVYYGYSAPLAWQKYGYTSYNLATAGAAGSLYKSMVKEVVKRQSPKLVIIEVSGYTWGDHRFKETPQYHNWLDNMEWSPEKIEALNELLTPEERMSYYFPFLTYHQMWKKPEQVIGTATLKGWLTINGYSNTKGFKAVSVSDHGKGSDNTRKVHFTAKSDYHLRQTLDACREAGIKNVLLLRFPMQTQMIHAENLDKFSEVAKEYGYDYLNLDKRFAEIGLDVKKDFVDDEHLNVSGLVKLTDYMGAYITKHYDVKREHDSETVEHWNTCYRRSQKIITSCERDFQKGKKQVYYELSTALFPHPFKSK